jgi:hypothetical protein
MTEQEIGRILAVLKAAWPDRKVLGDTLTAYGSALGDLPYEAVDAAVKQWLHTGKFFPAPSELRELALAGAIGLPSAEEAWGEVRRAIGEIGMYRVPRWTTWVLDQTVETLGWRSICTTEEDNVGTLRAQFRNTYQNIAKRQQQGDARPALAEARERRAELAELGRVAGYFGPGRPVQAMRAADGMPVLPPARPDWEDHYRAIGTNALSTVQARQRFAEEYPGKGCERQIDPRQLLDTLAVTPGWWGFSKDWRERQIEKYIARHPELGELRPLLAEMEAAQEQETNGGQRLTPAATARRGGRAGEQEGSGR